jgi:hypothetical protein
MATRKRYTPSKGFKVPGLPSGWIPVVLACAVVLALAVTLRIAGGGPTSAGAGASAGGSGQGTTVRGGKPLASCGLPGKPACLVDPQWFPITDASPSGAATAIRTSSAFAMMTQQYGGTVLDAPVLVQAYQAHTGVEYYDDDHWVVSVRCTSAGRECGIFDFVYDRAHQRIRFSSFGVVTPTDPHASQAFPYISYSAAISQLQSDRSMGMQVGSQPTLIFFPIDPRWRIPNSPVSKWRGGGDSPMDPMWRLRGADGHDYFVGVDSHVYGGGELPIASGQP